VNHLKEVLVEGGEEDGLRQREIPVEEKKKKVNVDSSKRKSHELRGRCFCAMEGKDSRLFRQKEKKFLNRGNFQQEQVSRGKAY